MDIHFNHTEPVHAPSQTLFEVITDYAGYPRFNPAVVKMTVVAKHENGSLVQPEELIERAKNAPPREDRDERPRGGDRGRRGGGRDRDRDRGPRR